MKKYIKSNTVIKYDQYTLTDTIYIDGNKYDVDFDVNIYYDEDTGMGGATIAGLDRGFKDYYAILPECNVEDVDEIEKQNWHIYDINNKIVKSISVGEALYQTNNEGIVGTIDAVIASVDYVESEIASLYKNS